MPKNLKWLEYEDRSLIQACRQFTDTPLKCPRHQDRDFWLQVHMVFLEKVTKYHETMQLAVGSNTRPEALSQSSSSHYKYPRRTVENLPRRYQLVLKEVKSFHECYLRAVQLKEKSSTVLDLILTAKQIYAQDKWMKEKQHQLNAQANRGDTPSAEDEDQESMVELVVGSSTEEEESKLLPYNPKQYQCKFLHCWEEFYLKLKVDHLPVQSSLLTTSFDPSSSTSASTANALLGSPKRAKSSTHSIRAPRPTRNLRDTSLGQSDTLILIEQHLADLVEQQGQMLKCLETLQLQAKVSMLSDGALKNEFLALYEDELKEVLPASARKRKRSV